MPDPGYLTGQILIAMPNMPDPRFARSVIYICAHSAEGAMGLVLNRVLDGLDFPSLLQQVGIDMPMQRSEIRVHFGGPVESGRGFVLHSADYVQESTLLIDEKIGLTATVDVLRAMASGQGPRHSLLALGYAGWGPGQLDSEIQANGWLHVAADEELVFGASIEEKWERAISKLGIDLSLLSSDAGHA